MDSPEIDRQLAQLELAIKRRHRHQGRRVVYQMLEYDLEPILKATDDPGYVRERMREILVRLGHSPEPLSRTSSLIEGNLGHLCVLAGQNASHEPQSGSELTRQGGSSRACPWGHNIAWST